MSSSILYLWLIIFYVYLLFCLFSFLCTSHSFQHESTLHSFFCFALFFFCTSLISFHYFFALFIFLFCFNIFLTTPNSLNNLIQSSVYIGMLIHLYISSTMFCLFVFLTVLIWSPTAVFQHFSKNDKQGWLTRWRNDGHRPSPILYSVVCLRGGERGICLGTPLFRGPLEMVACVSFPQFWWKT